MIRIAMHPLLLRQIEQALLDLSACPAAVAAVLQLVSETYQAFDDEKTVCREMERLDHIIEFLPDAIFAVDNEHRVIAWNKAMAVMTGVPKQEILGTGGFEYAIPFYGHPRPVLLDFIAKDPSQSYPMYSPEQTQNQTRATEVFVPALHGGRGAFVWTKASPLYDRQGRIAGAIQSIRDITEKKRSEITTRVLYLVSTAASTPMDNAELFSQVNDLLVWHLDIQILHIALPDFEIDTYTFSCLDQDSCASAEILTRLADLAAKVQQTMQPTIFTERPNLTETGYLGQTVWFASPLKYGSRILGSVVIVLPEDNLHFSTRDAPILASVADHLALAISRNATEQALRRSEEKHRLIFENATEGIFQASLDHDLLNANPALARILGYPDVESLMRHRKGFLRHLLSDKDRLTLMDQVLNQGRIDNFETSMSEGNKTRGWLSINMRTVQHPDGSIAYLEGSMRNVSQRKEAEQKLAVQKSLFQQLFDNSPQGILLLGADGAPQNLNLSFTAMFGFTRDDVDSLFEVLLPPDSLEENYSFLAKVLQGTAQSQETLRRHKDGHVIPVSMLGYPYLLDGKIAGAFFIFSDISERKDYENRLTTQALRDNLTGLPNRVLFMDRLNRAMERQKRNPGYRFAVLMIDLDSFKRVNDTLGHQAGDSLLKEVANRLTRGLRAIDTVARMGGDEFAIILEDFHTNRQAIDIAHRLLNDVRQPMQIQDREIQVSASIGIVLRTSHYQSPDEMIRDADICMYRSKEMGKNQFKIFSKSMYEKVLQAVEMENDLRRALVNEEFELFFQPIFTVSTGHLRGFEALVRWNHPRHGLLTPGSFIPLAEEAGLVSDIGKWVLSQGCRTLVRWQAMEAEQMPYLSLNLSPKDFLQPNLASDIAALLQQTRLDPSHLKLEITETAVMDNPEQTTSKLEKLQKLGVQIAMDDFGTGYSSLSYLQRLPIDILKIDRSFVQTMLENPSNLEIIKAIIGLGKILDLRIVAEGVETQDQLQILQDLGCDLAQGYLLGRPMPLESAEELLAKNPARQ